MAPQPAILLVVEDQGIQNESKGVRPILKSLTDSPGGDFPFFPFR
jgi:hypothetical protein